MNHYEIQLLGKDSLLKKSIAIDRHDQSIDELIQAMWKIMRQLKGAGLAAPQVGVNKRLLVFGFENNERYPAEQPILETVLINPEYEVIGSDTNVAWEGCLSVPHLRAQVERYTNIRYWGYNQQWQRIERVVSGFHARLIQHEIDHLDGMLLLDSVRDLSNLSYESVITKAPEPDYANWYLKVFA